MLDYVSALSPPPFRFTVYLTFNCNQSRSQRISAWTWRMVSHHWWPHVLCSKEAMNDIMKIANDSNTVVSAHINSITFFFAWIFFVRTDVGLSHKIPNGFCVHLSRNHYFKNEDNPSVWTFILGLDSGVFVSTLWLQCHSELRGKSRVGTISRWCCVRSHRNFGFRRGRRKQDFKGP